MSMMRGSGGLAAYRDRETMIFAAAGLVAIIFVGVYWMLLWVRMVKWTGWRIGATLGLTFGAGLFGVVAGAIAMVALEARDHSFGIFVGTMAAPLVWLAGTVLLWRETSRERRDRLASSRDAVVCPTCGYNLTGLTSTRCPECGAMLTLDALLRGQPSRAPAELEQG
jgi:predicted RNA-binding Zn-ribbon protein involved in translation (DUF1610 family)